jgi:oligopeptide/dipeptide ABC transporter ATP-binding protein
VPALLEVRDLAVRYEPPGRPPVSAVEGVDLELAEGEAVGIAGESASGKTTLLLAILGLLPAAARVARGQVLWQGRDLLAESEAGRRKVRGAQIAIVLQDPALALNPFRRVRSELMDVIGAHTPVPRTEARTRAERALSEVGFADPAAAGEAYPHELSGGQRQRVAIAQALVCGPALLLADEPTAALDTATGAEIRALLSDLQRRRGLAVLLVSHDLGAIAALAWRVLVMYAGRVVEEGPTAAVFGAPAHPYTRALLAASPRTRADGTPAPLVPIAGGPLDAGSLPLGCAFEPRCPDRLAACAEGPPAPVLHGGARRVRCIAHVA